MTIKYVSAIDECSSNPCLHGECQKIHNGYECCCDNGWTGRHCEISKSCRQWKATSVVWETSTHKVNIHLPTDHALVLIHK